eukprot:COSAG06_NODE_576_length_14051_cov_5.354644_8_plen_140_part_00
MHQVQVEIIELEVLECRRKRLFAARVVAVPRMVSLEQLRDDEQIFTLHNSLGKQLREGLANLFLVAVVRSAVNQSVACLYSRTQRGPNLAGLRRLERAEPEDRHCLSGIEIHGRRHNILGCWRRGGRGSDVRKQCREPP